MDRNDRIAVIGTWPRHPRPQETRSVHESDPAGWSAHHTSYRAEHGAVLQPPELLDTIQQRAHEIFEHRVRADVPGTAMDDWLQAEHEICARQLEIARGQGPHPAVPHKHR